MQQSTPRSVPVRVLVLDEVSSFDRSCLGNDVVGHAAGQPAEALEISLDASEIEALLAKLLEAPLQVRERVVHFLQASPQAALASRVDLYVCPATGAAQQRIVLEPTKALLDLAAALGATNVDLMVVQESSHGHPSRKEV